MNEVLVVDDEPEMLEILKLMLKDSGIHVDTCESGYDAVKKTGEKKYDLILLDIRMPGLDGWGTLKKLKEENRLKDTKIIILTIEKGPGEEIIGFQADVEDYITKPFDFQDLMKRIKSVLN